MARTVLVALLTLGLMSACVRDDPNNQPGDAGHDAGSEDDAGGGGDQEPNDSPEEASRLEVGDAIDGTIEERDDGHDADVFRFEVEPGETIRLEAEADDELQPVLFVSDSAEGVEAMLDDQVYAIHEAWPVDGTAALEFYHPDGAGMHEYYAVVVDSRNLPADSSEEPEGVGGESFGYSLSVEDTEWEAEQTSLPIETEETLEPIGSYLWYEFEVDDESLLGFETFTSVDDFWPDAAFLTEDGVELAAGPVGVPFEEGGTIVGGVGEPFYRGGSDYEFELILRQMPYGDLDFADLEASGDNDETDAAQDVTDDVPARITGTLGDESEEFTNEASHYYVVDLDENERLGLFTEEGDDEEAEPADTILTVYEPDEGQKILENDDYPLQPDTYFSAGFVTALSAGEYVIGVEPYCEEDGDETVCAGGDYALNVFTETPE
ncbi:MAG: hypothetical protein ACOCV2_05045 [Persicimonas sp.]